MSMILLSVFLHFAQYTYSIHQYEQVHSDIRSATFYMLLKIIASIDSALSLFVINKWKRFFRDCGCCSGWILIDRSGKHFGTILNFLRDGTVPLPEGRRDLLELQKEAKYYLIEELVTMIETQITSQAEVDPICKVPLITSQKEEQALVAATTKVNEMDAVCIV